MSRQFPASGTSRASSDNITIPATSYHASDQYTWSVWVWRDGSTTDLRRIWEKDPDTFELWHFQVGETHTINVNAPFSTARGEWRVENPTGWSTGSWVHILITYSHTSTAVDPSMYFNGTAATLTEFATPSGSPAKSGTNGWMMGNRPEDLARCWHGRLAEFAVWDRILTSQEISDLAAGSNPLTMDSGLQFYVPTYGDDSPEPDLGPNGWDGVVTNTVKGASHPPVDDPFSSAPLLATGTQTIADMVNENDNTTDLHLSVDDDPATPDDDDWVNNAVDVT